MILGTTFLNRVPKWCHKRREYTPPPQATSPLPNSPKFPLFRQNERSKSGRHVKSPTLHRHFPLSQSLMKSPALVIFWKVLETQFESCHCKNIKIIVGLSIVYCQLFNGSAEILSDNLICGPPSKTRPFFGPQPFVNRKSPTLYSWALGISGHIAHILH